MFSLRRTRLRNLPFKERLLNEREMKRPTRRRNVKMKRITITFHRHHLLEQLLKRKSLKRRNTLRRAQKAKQCCTGSSSLPVKRN
jgi:hypothetical protein